KLGPLQVNGGGTETHVPADDSPVVDAGSNPAGLTTDQRGVAFARVVGGAPDIGAVEVQHSFVVTNANDSGVGSLRQALINANFNPGADSVTFDPAFFSAAKVIGLTSGEMSVTDGVTVTGPGASLVTVMGGGSRILDMSFGGATPVNISGLTLTGGLGGNG